MSARASRPSKARRAQGGLHAEVAGWPASRQDPERPTVAVRADDGIRAVMPLAANHVNSLVGSSDSRSSESCLSLAAGRPRFLRPSRHGRTRGPLPRPAAQGGKRAEVGGGRAPTGDVAACGRPPWALPAPAGGTRTWWPAGGLPEGDGDRAAPARPARQQRPSGPACPAADVRFGPRLPCQVFLVADARKITPICA